MNRSGKIVVAALLIALAVILFNSKQVALGASADPKAPVIKDTPATASSNAIDSVTLLSPAPNTAVDESDDYATQALNDPWDMTTSSGDQRNLSGLNDISEPLNFTPPAISNGIWSATTAQNVPGQAPSFLLQYKNYPEAYSSLGEKDGQNYPIDATNYSRLLIRMNSAQAFDAIIVWYKGYNTAPSGNSPIFHILPGWNIYSVDLRQHGGGSAGDWASTGPYSQLMFQDLTGGFGNNIQVDWARLSHDAGSTVAITWRSTGQATDHVNLYLSTSSDASSDNELQIGSVSATAGAYNWNTSDVAPGSYYIHAELNGAVSSIGPLVVQPAAIARIDAPSPLTGEDFAYANLPTGGWTSNNARQFERVVNITNLIFGALEMRGTPTNGDPQLIWLSADSAHRIDTSLYRYFSQDMELDPPTSRQDSPYNLGPRLFWDDGSHSYPTTKILLWPYRVFEQRSWDLPNTGMVSGSWTGQLNYFRLDPNEEDGTFGRPLLLVPGFGLKGAHLTAMPVAGRTGSSGSGIYGTVIRWTTMQGGGTISLYRDTNNSGYNGVAIATGIPISQGYYDWDTGNVPAGTYYIYEVASGNTNGGLSTRSYSLVPIKVDRSQPSSLFTDVPPGYWAVDFINRLAMRNIVGGAVQPDSTVNFNPGSTASRAQLSKIVVLAAGWSLLNPASATFEDVAVGSTFYKYVETAASHGVISGYPCGGHGEPCDSGNRPYFRPNRNVTRGQTAKMVTISQGWTVITPSSPTFADVPYDAAPGSLYPYIETAAAKGIIAGYPCGGAGEPCDSHQRPYYRPGNSVTRAQLSKMISTALDAH